jgi:hypothetical protein
LFSIGGFVFKKNGFSEGLCVSFRSKGNLNLRSSYILNRSINVGTSTKSDQLVRHRVFLETIIARRKAINKIIDIVIILKAF